MGPIPIILIGKVAIIPLALAIKKFGIKAVGGVLLKTAVGAAILTATYKGMESINELRKN